MTEVTLFKNHHGNVSIASGMGVQGFMGSEGRFWTTDKALEKHLTKLAEAGEFGIYIDPNEPIVDTNVTDPMEALKAKIIKEAQQQGKLGGILPPSESVQTQADIQRSIVSTADSTINGNTQAELVAQEVIEKPTPAQSPALAALQNLTKK